MDGPAEIRGLFPPGDPGQLNQLPEVRRPVSGDSFANLLNRAVNSVDQNIRASEQSVQDFAAGKTENVHDIMISMQRAQLSFQLMVEIRNKAIEAYQEISRMQI